MQDVLLWSLATKAIYATLAVVLLWLLLRLWNRLTGSRFDEAHSRITGDPVGAGIYYGLRFVAIALLVGFILA